MKLPNSGHYQFGKLQNFIELTIEIWQATEDISVKVPNQAMPANLKNNTMANRLEDINLHTNTTEKRYNRV